MHAPTNTRTFSDEQEKADRDPPDPLQIASKMFSRRPRKAKSRSSTTRVAQNPILGTTYPNRTLQRHPKMVARSFQKHPKSRLGMIGEQATIFSSFRKGQEEGFGATGTFFSKVLNVFISCLAQLRFLKDVLSVLPIFGNRGGYILA